MSKSKLPATSMEAYRHKDMPDMISAHHFKIIMALRASKLGMMYEQIAGNTRLEKHQIGRRISELEKKQLIYKTGEKRKTSTNRNAFVYKLTPDGEAYIIPEKYLPGKSISQHSKEIHEIQLKLL